MPVWSLYVLNCIAAILIVIGWRRMKPWMVYLGQGIAQFALIVALGLLLA